MMRLLRAPLTWVLTLALASAALYWFQPWKLVTDREVNEALAVIPSPAGTSAPASASESASASVAAPVSAPPPGPAVVRAGDFISHEHDTTGSARVVRHPDGSHVLELAGLDTSDGPDLRVWLSDQPVRPGTAGWHVFDDGEWAELGPLKGNRGDQTYAIPAGTDLERLDSVSIWCIRFSVSFGAATLAPTA